MSLPREPVREPFTVAAVEFDPQFLALDANLPRLAAVVEEAARAGARLIVLPEAATSGYIYKDSAQLGPFLDSIPGKATQVLERLTRQYGAYVVVGIAETDPETGLAYNTAALIGPDGLIGKYRKMGLNPTDQLFFSPGNLGVPVFDTPLGRIALNICFDDVYWELSRVAAVKGADILAYLSASDREFQNESGAWYNHSTIAMVQSMNAWNGMALIATDRKNTETNPATGVSVYSGGAAAIWSPGGRKIAQAPTTAANSPPPPDSPPFILYGTIDPREYDNPIKRRLQERRPELYRELLFYRAPVDEAASMKSYRVEAALAQYTPAEGDSRANFAKIEKLLQAAAGKPNLLVAPAYSATGVPPDAAAARRYAETPDGLTVQRFAGLAVEARMHVVFSMVERAGDRLYHTAFLVSDRGTITGRYRQTHLEEAEKQWAAAGDDLPVFATPLGRIGLLLGGDACFPEVSGVYAVRRADILAIPSAWHGQYGGHLDVSPKLFARAYPPNTMIYWHAIARTAQAYTLAANYVGGGAGYKGSSGLFTLDPVEGHVPACVASADREELLLAPFETLGHEDWYMNQSRLIVGRNVCIIPPLTFPLDSRAFQEWQHRPGFDFTVWAPFLQGN
jgi:predicted amidohydrolase